MLLYPSIHTKNGCMRKRVHSLFFSIFTLFSEFFFQYFPHFCLKLCNRLQINKKRAENGSFHKVTFHFYDAPFDLCNIFIILCRLYLWIITNIRSIIAAITDVRINTG